MCVVNTDFLSMACTLELVWIDVCLGDLSQRCLLPLSLIKRTEQRPLNQRWNISRENVTSRYQQNKY